MIQVLVVSAVGLATLYGSMRLLATRVVHSPINLNGKSAISNDSVTSTRGHAQDTGVLPSLQPHGQVRAPESYAQAYMDHIDAENQHHVWELAGARAMRRRASSKAASRSLTQERLRHARMAVALHKIVGAEHSLTFFQPIDQFRVERWYERRKHALLAGQLGGGEDQPLPLPRAAWYWITGGPRSGASEELVQFHLAEKRHYGNLRRPSKRYVKLGLEEQARNALHAELVYHVQQSFSPGQPVEPW